MLVVPGISSARDRTANPITMEFITFNGREISNIDIAEDKMITVKVYNLDAQLNLQDKLSEGLPRDHDTALKMAKERVASVPHKTFEDMWKGALLAKRYKINKAPALIIDEELVIYGITDVKEALKIFYKYQKGSR